MSPTSHAREQADGSVDSMSRDAGPLAVPDEVKATIRVLVVDDEHTLRESCASLLKSEGFDVTVCGRGDEADRLIRSKPFDIVLADLFMEPVGGIELVEVAQDVGTGTIVILMTGNPTVESSIEGLRAGAWDYLAKPFSAAHLHVVMGRAAHAVVVARESAAEREAEEAPTSEAAAPSAAPKKSKPAPAPTSSGDPDLMGESASFLRAVELARKVAQTDASVFITGESGTGKELIAHFIHNHSRRRARSLVIVNSAAIPESLLESEMFGHTEGAFTGAVRDKEGLLETANGGTLFLDELTEMPMSIQAKLLRVIQDGIVRRVGSTKTDAVVNVRFIAASNVDPMEAVRLGQLRKDLYYRLRVVPILLPPLRERVDDIPKLARYYLGEFWRQHRSDTSSVPELSSGAIAALQGWPWRGNVRELRNVMEHLAVLSDAGQLIHESEIPFISEEADSGAAGFSFEYQVQGHDYHTARDNVLADFERRYLEFAVRKAGGNISDAARMAGVDRTTLYRLMEKHRTSKQDLLDADRG